MHHIGLEAEFLKLFFRLQRLQWENYAEGKEHNLSAVDTELFQLFSGREQDFPQDRRGQVLQALMQRTLVDKDPAVSLLRNRIDGAYYCRAEELSARDLAQAMRADVLRLMELRTSLSRSHGFNSYPELVLFCEGLDLDWVKNRLEDFVRAKLPMAKALIKRYNISWATWFKDLAKLGRSMQADALTCVNQLIDALGLDEARPAIHIVVKNQPIAGVAMALDVPGDVRILLRPVQSLAQLSTLYHELGHALGHACNRQRGIFKTWTAVHDETMAIAIERIGLDLFGDEEMQAAAGELALLEDLRCALSFLLEMDIYSAPDRAEELYRLHYGRLAADPGDGALWSLDTFRSIDPAYIHNYVLGGIIADNMLQCLKRKFGDNPSAWGTWLRDNWYAPGRSLSLQDKIEAAGLRLNV